MLDELIIAGYLSESSKRAVVRVVRDQDELEINEKDDNEKPLTRTDVAKMLFNSGMM